MYGFWSDFLLLAMQVRSMQSLKLWSPQVGGIKMSEPLLYPHPTPLRGGFVFELVVFGANQTVTYQSQDFPFTRLFHWSCVVVELVRLGPLSIFQNFPDCIQHALAYSAC